MYIIGSIVPLTKHIFFSILIVIFGPNIGLTTHSRIFQIPLAKGDRSVRKRALPVGDNASERFCSFEELNFINDHLYDSVFKKPMS